MQIPRAEPERPKRGRPDAGPRACPPARPPRILASRAGPHGGIAHPARVPGPCGGFVGVRDSPRRTRSVGRPRTGAGGGRIPQRGGQVVRPRDPDGRHVRSVEPRGSDRSRRRLRSSHRRVRVVPRIPSDGPPRARDEGGFPGAVWLQGRRRTRPARRGGLPSRISVSACRGRNRIPPGGASGGGPRGVRSDSAHGRQGDRRGAESRSRAPPPRTNARSDRHFPEGARERPGTRRGAQQSRRRLSADGRAEAGGIESGPRRETRRLSADPTQPREGPEGADATESQEARGAKETGSVGAPFGNNQYGSRRGGIGAGTIHGMGGRLRRWQVAPHPESGARGRRLRGRPRPRKGTGIPPLGREPKQARRVSETGRTRLAVPPSVLRSVSGRRQRYHGEPRFRRLCGGYRHRDRNLAAVLPGPSRSVRKDAESRSDPTYGRFARYYDIIYHEIVNYEGDVDFLEAVFRRYRVKPRTILDVGCGTGNHDIPLARRSYRVTGLDQSSAMLSVARKKTAESRVRVRFVRADMRSFRIMKQFDAVLCMFGASGYIMPSGDVVRVLRRVRAHIGPGGLFIFEFWQGSAARPAPHPSWIHIRKPDLEIVRLDESRYDPRTERLPVEFRFFVFRGRRVIDRFDELHTIQTYSVPGIRTLLRRGGFDLLGAFAATNMKKAFTPVTRDTFPIMAVARAR